MIIANVVKIIKRHLQSIVAASIRVPIITAGCRHLQLIGFEEEEGVKKRQTCESTATTGGACSGGTRRPASGSELSAARLQKLTIVDGGGGAETRAFEPFCTICTCGGGICVAPPPPLTGAIAYILPEPCNRSN